MKNELKMTGFKEKHEASVNVYRDILNIKNTVYEKGIEIEKIGIAKEMLNKGIEISMICEITKLTENYGNTKID